MNSVHLLLLLLLLLLLFIVVSIVIVIVIVIMPIHIILPNALLSMLSLLKVVMSHVLCGKPQL